MTDPRVAVTRSDGIVPVAEMIDPRGFDTADQLAAEIIRQANSPDLTETNRQLYAETTGAAVTQRAFVEEHIADVEATRRHLIEEKLPPNPEPGDVLREIRSLAEAIRANAAHVPTPTIGDTAAQSGVSAASTGAAVITERSTGSGDGWQPGSGVGRIGEMIESTYEDENHPVRRLWRAFTERIFG